MQWRARILGPVVAGVLGVTGGVATAVLSSPSAPPAFADPLGLGVPLRNLPCDGEAILVVGHGDTRAALDSGVANNRGQARYLQTAKSCPTQLNAENSNTKPAYVAYAGPYPDLEQPCRLRMTAQHATTYVARLREGNTQLVKCPCVLPTDAAPTLQVEKVPTAYHNVWARSLQGMLHDDNPKAFPHSDITGTYDAITQRYIQAKFQVPAGYLGRNGLMDSTTWQIVTGKICPSYSY